MPYMEKTYNLNERFENVSKSSKGEDFKIRYTPIGWCPLRVAVNAEKVSKQLGNPELATDPWKQIELMLPTIGEVVVDWNLEYEVIVPSEDIDTDDVVEIKKIPHPRKIARLKEDDPNRMGLMLQLPLEIMQSFFTDAFRMESELPLEKLSESVNGSLDLKVPQLESEVTDTLRSLTPVPTTAELAEAQLKELDLQLKTPSPSGQPSVS